MKRLLLIAMAVLTLGMSGFAQQTITVCDGTTTNSYVPIYGYYTDAYTKSQFIYQSSEFSQMPAGASITSMTFYASPSSVNWGATWKVYMNSTSLTTLGSSYETALGTEVYNGALQINNNGETVVQFSNNFTYSGGNVLVTFEQQTTGTYISASYYGVEQGVSLRGYDYDDVSQASCYSSTFTPKATMTYVGGDPNFCYQPSNLTVSDIETDSAFVSFQPGATETAWTLKWGLKDFDPETAGNVVNLTDTTYQLAGLSSGTFYDVYVRSECAATSNYSFWSKASFKTLSVPATLPYATDFGADADNGQWNMSGTGAQFVIGADTNDAASYSAGGALFVSADGGNTITNYGSASSYAVRDVSLPSGNFVVSYRWKGNGSSAYGRALLAPGNHSLYASIGSDFVPQEWIDLGNGALTGATTWQIANAEFNITTAGDYKLVFYWYNNSYSSCEGLCIDDVSVMALTCPAPVNFRMETADTLTATLAWHENGTATSWTVEYGPKNFIQGTGTFLQATDTIITITGLQPNTKYDAFVVANCSATDASNPAFLTFVTDCPQYQPVPYFEDFDSYAGYTDYYNQPGNNLPGCWSHINTGSSAYSAMPIIYNSSSYAYSGNNCIYAYIYSGGADQYAILPAFNNINTVQISFMARKTYSSDNSMIEVGVMDPSDATTFTTVATVLPSSTGYENFVVCFDTYTGSYNNIALRFPHINNGYNYALVDDVMVEYIPSCKKPVNLNIAGTTINTLELTWTDDNLTPAAGGYDIEWGAQNFVQGTGTLVHTDTTWYELTDLTPGYYDMYVRSICGAGDTSQWVGPLTAAPGEVIVGNGNDQQYYGWNNCYKNSWSQNLYMSSEVPAGLITQLSFYVANTGGSGSTFTTAKIYLGETSQTSNSAWVPFDDQILVYSTNNLIINQTGWLIFELQTPYFYDGGDNLVISLSKTMSDYNCDMYWQGSSVANGCMYVQSDSEASAANYPSGSGYTQSFRMNVRVTYGDASSYCAKPKMPVVSQNGITTATIAWEPGNLETAWELKYDTAGFDVETAGTMVTPLTQTSYELTNLTDSTDYDVYVRSICDSISVSDWRGPLSFTTLPMCAAPTNFHVVSSTTTAFTFAWTPGYTETQWTIEYDTTGFVQGTGTTVNVSTDPTIEIGNLTSGISYDFYIRSNCDSTMQSIWVGPYTWVLGEITIGNGTATSSYLPIYGYYGYSYSQQIYLASEMTGQNMIEAVKIYVTTSAPSPNIGGIKIFMGHTSKSSFSNSTDYVDPVTLELVYEDPSQWQMQQGWNTFVLDEPFVYDGVSNLVFGFYEGASGYASPYPYFQTHATADNMSIMHYSDTESDVSYTDPSSADGSTSFQKYRNNIKFVVSPVDPNYCFAPANVNIEVNDDFTAVASWVSSAPSVVLTWGTYGFDPDSAGTQLTLAVDTFAFTGLTPNTYYEMYLQSICTDTTSSIVKGPFGFRTPCGTSTTVPFSEDFDTWSGASSTYASSGIIPTCWNSINTGTETYYNYPYILANGGVDGSNAMYFYSYYYNESYYTSDYGEQYIILPPFDNVSTLQVEFWGRGSSGIGTAVVGIMDTIDQNTFVAIDTFNFSSEQFNYEISYLSSYTGTGRYIAIKAPYATDGTTNSFSIDNITVSEIPSCPPATKLQVLAVDTASATVKWQENGSATSWEIEYGAIGFAHGSGTIIQAPTNPFTITGLTNSTGYQFYVRPTCGATWSVQAKVFYTAQIPATLPYSCGFESDDPESTKWTLENGDAVNQWFIGTDMYNYGAYAGQGGLYVSYEMPGAPVGMVNYYNTSAPSKVYAYRTFNLEAGDYVVTFKWKSNGEENNDYIRAFLAPTSSVLTAGQSNGITHSNTPDGWIAVGGELSLVQNWETYYNEEIHVTDGGMYNLVFYWVNDASSGDYPAPAIDNVQVFAMTCPLPSNLTCTAADVSTATLSWTEMSTATAWNIEYGAEGFAQGTGTVVPANTNPFTITGLDASTIYDAYVQSVCGPDDVSGWRGPVTFQTQSCNAYEMCPFTLHVEDEVADGWMGNSIEIFNGPNLLGSYTMYSGVYAKDYSVSACPGEVSLTWHVGAFPNECHIIVIGNAGDTLYTCNDASVLADGETFFTFTHSCQEACETPADFTAVKSATGATLSWTAVADVESYSVYRNNTKIAGDVTGTTYDDAVTTNGHYCYKVTSNCAGGNESTPSTEVCVDTDVNVLENAAEAARIYPNPTNNKVKVEAKGMTRVDVMSVLGQKIYSTEIDADEFEFDFSSYGAGVYMMHIETTTGSATRRLTVVK